jgi:hypothetical protein
MTDREDNIENTAKLLGVDEDELIGGLNLPEASRLLGIAPSTLRQRALNGHIGYQRDGRSWIFYWWHLSDYLNKREHPADERTGGTSGEGGQGIRPGKARVSEKELKKARQMGLID